MTTKDENDLRREGKLPVNPEEDTVEVLKDGTPKIPLLRLDALFKDALRRAGARSLGDEKPVPVPWKHLAEQLGGGLWPGLHVLVGGTGTGKSTLALQIALEAAKQNVPTGYIGLELGELDLALRVLGEKAGISWSRLYTGKAVTVELEKAAEASAALTALNLPFYCELGRPNGWPVSELETFAERMREAHPDDPKGSAPMLLVLDFLQIVGDEHREDGRMMGFELRERIGRAAYFARDIARRLNVAVLCISSAARNNYDALSDIATSKAKIDVFKDHRVVMNPDALVGMGKESGELEYSADSVTVAIRGPAVPSLGAAERPILLVTAKGRATGASWCALRFVEGRRFEAWDSSVVEVLAALEKTKTEGASPSKTPSKAPPPSRTTTTSKAAQAEAETDEMTAAEIRAKYGDIL